MTSLSPHALAAVDAHFEASTTEASRFFSEQAEAVSETCRAMAERFRRGGRLLVYGADAQASDAHHVAVEFVHPVIVGKRALPALALTAPAAGGGTAASAPVLENWLEAIARPDDIFVVITGTSHSELAAAALTRARARGLLTVHLAGGKQLPAAAAEHLLHVRCEDALVVQEVHETTYHVLWELVHVFFERGVA